MKIDKTNRIFFLFYEKIIKMKKFLLSILTISFSVLCSAQEEEQKSDVFYADVVVGPYLMVSSTPYKSVFLKGLRLGYENKNGLTFSLEYLSGNQEDVSDQTGMTHSAFGGLSYYLSKNDDKKFRPYILAAGGFFEFKDFASDVLGVAYYIGAGTELNFSSNIKGYFEPRYVNLAPLDIDGEHQLGVMWGLRAKF